MTPQERYELMRHDALRIAFGQQPIGFARAKKGKAKSGLVYRIVYPKKAPPPPDPWVSPGMNARVARMDRRVQYQLGKELFQSILKKSSKK